MVPDKIYIAETPNKLIEIWSEEPIEPKPYITEHEYICKDTLLEWVKKELESAKITNFDEFGSGEVITWERVFHKLNSM